MCAFSWAEWGIQREKTNAWSGTRDRRVAGVNQVHVSLGMRFEIVDFLLRAKGAMEVLSGADQRAYYVSKLVSFTWTILENPAAALKGRGNSPPLENEKTESQRRYTTQPKSPI